MRPTDTAPARSRREGALAVAVVLVVMTAALSVGGSPQIGTEPIALSTRVAPREAGEPFEFEVTVENLGLRPFEVDAEMFELRSDERTLSAVPTRNAVGFATRMLEPGDAATGNLAFAVPAGSAAVTLHVVDDVAEPLTVTLGSL